MIIEALRPLHIRRAGGDLHLLPGQAIELEAAEAQRLLTKANGMVRAVTIEAASKPDGSPLSPIYWEAGNGRILGPAVPELFARCGNAFWISTTFKGHILWINADRLRSRKAFEQQTEVIEFDPIR